MNSKSLFQPVIAGLVLLGLTACSTPSAENTDDATNASVAAPQTAKQTPPDVHYNDQTLSDVLIAEVAAQNGNLKAALAHYTKQAAETRDPMLAKQAARLALYMQRPQTALQMAQIWLDAQPNNLTAWQIVTLSNVLLGQTDAASQAIEKQIQIDPKAGLQKLLANSSELAPQQQQVLVAALGKLAEQHPEQAALWYAKARAEQYNQDFKAALRACDRAIELRPDHLESRLLKADLLIELKRPNDARQLLATQREAHPDNKALAMTYIRLLLKQQRTDEAQSALQDFAEQFPKAQKSQFTLALIAIREHNSQLAIPLLKQLRKTEFRPGETGYFLGKALEKQNQPDAAIDAFLSVTGKHRLPAASAAARLLYETNQPERAAALFDMLRQRFSDRAARLYAVQASLLIQQDKAQLAKPVLHDGIAQYPQDTDLLYLRAMQQGAEKHYEQMEHDLRTILEIEPNNVNALNALGYTLSNHSDQYHEAWYYIKRAYARQPENHAIQDSLGWVLYRLGRYSRAVSLLQKAYKGQPGPEVAAHLIQALRANNQTDKADALLKKALQAHPGSHFLTDLTRDSHQ